MILYRVVRKGVCLLETRDRTLAAEVASDCGAFDYPAEVWAVSTPPSAYDRAYTRKLFAAVALVVAIYVLAVVTGHW